MPLNDEDKTALNALLAKADASDLPDSVPGHVTQATLTSRLGDKDTRRKTDLAAEVAARADLQSKFDADQAELKKYRDADLSAEQLRDQALVDAEKRFDAQGALLDKATARGDALYLKAQTAFVRDSVRALITASGAPALNGTTAVREALAENSFAVEDDDGVFSLKMTVDGLEASNPAEAFTAWWKTRTDLHGKRGTELPSPGAAVPGNGPAPEDPTKGLTPEQAFSKGLHEFG